MGKTAKYNSKFSKLKISFIFQKMLMVYKDTRTMQFIIKPLLLVKITEVCL